MWAGMIGCCFDCKLKIVRQACAVHVGGAPRSLCPAGGLRRFHARSLPMLECECCHLSLNLQELDLDSNFFTYLRPNAFMIVRGGRAWGRSLDYHAQKVFTDSENVHHLHILLCLVLRAIGSSSRSFDFHIRNTRPIKGMVECY